MRYDVYHWDSFDNEKLFLISKLSLEEAEKYVKEHYGSRVNSDGADFVDIVESEKRNVVRTYRVT